MSHRIPVAGYARDYIMDVTTGIPPGEILYHSGTPSVEEDLVAFETFHGEGPRDDRTQGHVFVDRQGALRNAAFPTALWMWYMKDSIRFCTRLDAESRQHTSFFVAPTVFCASP